MSEMSITLASRSCGFGASAVRVGASARAADAPVDCVRASAFVAMRSVAIPAHGAAARVACVRALAAAVASETDQP